MRDRRIMNKKRLSSPPRQPSSLSAPHMGRERKLKNGGKEKRSAADEKILLRAVGLKRGGKEMREENDKEKDYVEIEVELPQWMIDKAEKKHLDLSKILTEELEKEIERLAKEKRERDRKEKKKEKKS